MRFGLVEIIMYKFHYEKMVSRYESNVRLCFTNTDSLLYEIKTANILKDIAQHIDECDFSDYPKDRHVYNTHHKKEMGKFKDERNGMTLEEFIGLRPKYYSLLFLGEVKNNQIIHTDVTEKQIATKAGVKKAYLRHHYYKDTLNNLSTIKVKQNVITSKQHNINISSKQSSIDGF